MNLCQLLEMRTDSQLEDANRWRSKFFAAATICIVAQIGDLILAFMEPSKIKYNGMPEAED